MRRLTTLVALGVAFTVSASEAAKPPSRPTTAGKPAMTKTQTPKGGATKASTVKVSPSKGPAAKGASLSGSKSVKPTKTTAQVARGGGQTKVSSKADKSVKKPGAQAKVDAKPTKETRTSTSTTSAPTIDFTATKVGTLLEKNPTLRSKIEAKLQAAGYTGTAYEAGYGFKNVGQLNAATNMVQNQGTSFELLKVLMTGTYVDPVTHNVYRTQKLPDGTTQLVKPELATNRASTLSLGQAKQAITGGAVMPEIVVYGTTGTSTMTTTSSTATSGSLSSTAGKSKPRKSHANTSTTQPGGGF